MNPTVLLLDCDGVIRHWDQDEFAGLADRAGCSTAALAAIAFDDGLLGPAMVGAITAEAWAEEIGRRAAAAHGADAADVSARFARLGWTIDDTVLAIAGRVRAAGHRVAILSNASTRLEDDLMSSGVTEAVDVVLSSARLGVAKPDPAIYAAAASALGVEPAACLFIDDQIVNVHAARAAGMLSELFMGSSSLVTLLGQVGLLAG